MALIEQIMHLETFDADTTVEQAVNTSASRLQLVINSGTATAGTATITAKALGGANFETVYDQFGAALTHTFTASASKTFVISAGEGVLLRSIKVATSGMNGTFSLSIIALD